MFACLCDTCSSLSFSIALRKCSVHRKRNELFQVCGNSRVQCVPDEHDEHDDDVFAKCLVVCAVCKSAVTSVRMAVGMVCGAVCAVPSEVVLVVMGMEGLGFVVW